MGILRHWQSFTNHLVQLFAHPLYNLIKMGGMQNWNRKAKEVVEQAKIFVGQAKQLCVQ